MNDYLFGEFGQRFAEPDNPWQEIGKEKTDLQMAVDEAFSPSTHVLELRENPTRLCIKIDELRNRGGDIPQNFSIHADSFLAWLDTNIKYQLLWNDHEALNEFCKAAILPDHEIVTNLVENELCFISLHRPMQFVSPVDNLPKTAAIPESPVIDEATLTYQVSTAKPVLRSRRLIDYFPFTTPRDGQMETCAEIIDAFKRGYTDVILEGPCGSGKSVLAMTILRYLLATSEGNTDSFIATPLKTLQNQYAAEPAFIDYMRVVKGMSAYRCAMSRSFSPACSSKGAKARAAMRKQCRNEGICAYYNAIADAQKSNLVLHNMASLIFQCSPFGHHFTPRNFLVADEAHTCEDALLELFSFSISKKMLLKYDPKGQVRWLEWPSKYDKPSFEDVNAWLDGVKMVLTLYLTANKDHLKEVDEKALERILDNISRYETAMDRWVCSMTDPDAYVFKPLDVSDYASLITNKGDKRLWMSATILGKENFAKSLGLDARKCYFISLPSTFPKQNRPIYACENYGIKSLNAREIDKNMPLLIDGVDDIISHYPNEKGLIHTHTYKILHALVNNSKYKHRFVFHDSTNREEVLGDFIRSTEPLILVSPSMIEGIDLKDDLGRFQILCKIPWPYLGDAQIAALKDYREGWYVWKCSLDVVQACGRIVRHEKDWGHTYVIDPDFRRWREVAWNILPKYFKESIVFVK